MIKVLPPQIVNQIAAGEVIERPFSVVKELVENSIDAGATRVHVELEDGGTRLIRISDDGCGFTPADLELAFVSHATSKLGALDDLDHIASLGFRGEALASVGAISRAWIKSRVPGAEAGAEIRNEGGEIGALRPCGTPPGSIIEIRDLFFNTPARRRFLKAPRAEKARCQDLLVKLALARLDIDFRLTVDGKEVLVLPAGESLRDRVGRCFGRQLAKGLREVCHESGKYRVEGLCGDPDQARRDATQELLYINGRCAKDRSVMFAIRQAYKEFLMHGRYPVYFLQLHLPPEEVDVNVHPTKSEVRFVDSRHAAGVLHAGVKQALEAGFGRAASLQVGDGMPRARSGLPELPQGLFGSGGAATPPPAAAAATPQVELVRESAPAAAEEPVVEVRPNPFHRLRESRFLQVLNLYLVFEGDDGIVVVDQHALHERVLYEQFKARHDSRETKVQRLLVPEVLELSATDKDWLLSAQDSLAGEGLLIEDFGGNSLAVQGIPVVLHKANPRKLIEVFLKGDGEGRPSAREAIVERFHSMACRAAIMSGDKLSDEEIKALLADAQTLEHPHNCPHGRPTVLTFEAPELERYFRRKV